MSLPDFANPYALLLVLLVPVYLLVRKWRVTTVAVRYPSVRHLKRLPRSARQRCRVILPLLRGLGLLLLIIVLARPVLQLKTEETPTQGIAIAMVLDRSGSMGFPENKIEYEGEPRLRFNVAQDVFKRFVEGDKALSGRPNDLIGLFTFGTYPQTDHPFSLNHTSLVRAVDKMSAEKMYLDAVGKPTADPRTARRLTDARGRQLYDMRTGQPALQPNPMSATDLKKAIEYGADKLILLGEDLARSSRGLRKYDLKDKVMVLLTDGEPTVGGGPGQGYPDDKTIEKLTGAGIRVYFVQIFSRKVYVERPDGTVEVHLRPLRTVDPIIKEAEALAERTRGRHFLVTNGDQLKEVYAEIDQIEKSELGEQMVYARDERYAHYLLAALALLAAEQVLGLTWLRRAP